MPFIFCIWCVHGLWPPSQVGFIGALCKWHTTRVRGPWYLTSHPRDGTPLSAVVELGDFRGGGLWMECGGKLWAPKCKTTREVVQVVNHLGRGVPGFVCSARKGLVFNSGAYTGRGIGKERGGPLFCTTVQMLAQRHYRTMRNLWHVGFHLVDGLVAGGTADHLIATNCHLTFIFALFAFANDANGNFCVRATRACNKVPYRAPHRAIRGRDKVPCCTPCCTPLLLQIAAFSK